ncbi:MAG: tRNA-dihydrouridine synthase family protein [Spirochaetales bacterium]|nr:tRNA-dihydrouridine synthase family protein [Spirochaetales bacterium]
MLPFSSRSLLLAPMVGITNRAFRTLLEELGGPDYAFTEMASAEAYISNAPFESVYTDPRPRPERTSVQFFARSAESLAAACAKLKNNTLHGLPAGVDINFGCSAPHIRSKKGGSAWSSDPEQAAELVAAARSVWPGTLSAKVRLGPDDDYDRLLAFCSRIVEAGLDFLCIHPRRDDQKFKGKARHGYSLRLAKDISCPLAANGDIVSAAQLAILFNENGSGAKMTEGGAEKKELDADLQGAIVTDHPSGTGGAGVYAAMIGREAVRKPWIFALLRASLASGSIDRMAVGLRFIALAELYLPEAWRLESARRFFSYYCEQFSFAHHVKYKTMNSPNLGAMAETFAAYFDQLPGDRYWMQSH